MRIDIDELSARAGHALGFSPWQVITQDQVNSFAEASGDKQWIHTDPQRAKSGPFGGTIAHGLLTLGLALTSVIQEVAVVSGARLIINYGTNRLRFPAPVPVGARIRTGVDLLTLDEVEGGVQAAFRVTVEVENTKKPACVAELLLRYYREPPSQAGAQSGAIA
ncbi:MAG: 3-hydroxyacyl-thioester dehydratase HtdZ [Pseudarthrobacter sp.]